MPDDKRSQKDDLLEEILFTLRLRRSSKKFTIFNVILADESAYAQLFFHVLQWDFIISTYADLIDILVLSF